MKVSNCSDPQVVYNKYLGREISVPCGKCPSCRLAQGAEWKQKLQEEFKIWKHVLFFTLTFRDEYLPTATLLYKEVPELPHINSFEERSKFLLNSTVIRHDVDCDSKTKENLIFTANISDYERDFIAQYEKVCGKNKFPILSKTYAKNFVKVLTRLCSEYCDKSDFRIYIIGEYGPSSFRPHFHGLFFTNYSDFCKEQFVPCSLSNLINLSWSNMVLDNCEIFKFSLGFTDCQKTDKSPRTASYVSQYLSSITNLPQVFQQKYSLPFRYCSKERSVGYVESDAETLFERFYLGTCTRVVYDSQKLEHRLDVLPRSYRTRLFPEHRGFNSISLRNFGTWLVLASLCSSSMNFVQFVSDYDIESDSLDLHSILDITPDEHLIDRVRSLYYSLNKCFNLCIELECQPCDYGFYYQQFQSKLKLFQLRQFYELQSSLSLDPHFDITFLNCLYLNHSILKRRPVVACDNFDFYSSIDNCPEHISDRLKSLKVLLNSTKSKKRNDFLTNKEFTKFNF